MSILNSSLTGNKVLWKLVSRDINSTINESIILEFSPSEKYIKLKTYNKEEWKETNKIQFLEDLGKPFPRHLNISSEFVDSYYSSFDSLSSYFNTSFLDNSYNFNESSNNIETDVLR